MNMFLFQLPVPLNSFALLQQQRLCVLICEQFLGCSEIVQFHFVCNRKPFAMEFCNFRVERGERRGFWFILGWRSCDEKNNSAN